MAYAPRAGEELMSLRTSSISSIEKRSEPSGLRA
jgi:hypothetical protein